MGQVGDTPTPDQWFKALPIITQYWFGATMVITLSVNFNIISAYQVRIVCFVDDNIPCLVSGTQLT